VQRNKTLSRGTVKLNGKLFIIKV